MGRYGRVALLLAAMTFPPVATGATEVPDVDGTWMIRDLVLEIFKCQNQVCGRITWIRDARRLRSQCGSTIVWGLTADGPAKWSNGTILDPDDGNTYRLSASLQEDGALNARIYKGIPLFGKTEILKRVDARSLSGRC